MVYLPTQMERFGLMHDLHNYGMAWNLKYDMFCFG